ncbi:ATP-binding cassette domain-containing protein [Corallococcus exercitus]|uniref:ATP-binding cassette domain-containing protein n=1 Tax=Corallococcus exercitus TaxID=2316736 RepID=UPI000EA22FC7|nr:ATP-binding cassette domain-containing protein [Corallococcus exercitus]RKG82050.1 ATP-binding cassette domain-containing protein [Corallococcus exercitus]
MHTPRAARQRAWFVPEVIQTSAMDCGPAALKSLLGGLGVFLHYGHLREVCQTTVDGTSIDTLETICLHLGLQASQHVVPLDHLFQRDVDHFPALLVTRLPSGAPHFIVVWNRVGGFLQVMDPGSGRRWVHARQLAEDAYLHTLAVGAMDWKTLALAAGFEAATRGRLRRLGATPQEADRLLARAVDDASWYPMASLDAATRMVTSLGGTSERVEALWALARAPGVNASEVIPSMYWSARPMPVEEGEDEAVLLSGAVLLKVRPASAEGDAAAPVAGPDSASLPPGLADALSEPPGRPGRLLWDQLRTEGSGALLALGFGLALATVTTVVQALVFRGLIDLASLLGTPWERAGAILAVVVLLMTMVLLEWPVATALKRVGRGLEIRLRVELFKVLPRLSDRYFSSRLSSDMGHRSHQLHMVRNLPELVGRTARDVLEFTLIASGLVWLAPALALPVMTAAALAIAAPLLLQPLIRQSDLRVRTHSGALGRFYLDAFLGLMPIRTHGAERSMLREQERLLVGWSRASQSVLSASLLTEALQALVAVTVAVWLFVSYRNQASTTNANALLVAFWALRVPMLGQSIAASLREYPVQRNVMLRALETLGSASPSPSNMGPPAQAVPTPSTGADIQLKQVEVRALGHTLLSDLTLHLPAGAHVAVVGPSGAGKSTLAHLLLGLQQPAAGTLHVDGQPLEGAHLEQLLSHVAWVDPATQLWNRSLLENLAYGASSHTPPALGELLQQAELLSVLEHLPEGLQTHLGEGGALVSGGEGQRVRLGRAMHRAGARLVVLDEPFRGLDRERRKALLGKARALWKDSTLLCITHDIEETREFPRVLVIQQGRLVEDGPPDALLARTGSVYRELLEGEARSRETLWNATDWRRWRMVGGRLEGRGGAEP